MSQPTDRLSGMSAARFGVYVHFPYCLSKCPYCDFASTVARQIPEQRYTQAILAELVLRLRAWPDVARRRIDSVYFGGGTPSLWSAVNVGAVLDAVARAFTLGADAEVTLEANPGASDMERFRDFSALGINRLSMGIQSFEPKTLAALGREHDGPTAERAYRAAREAGFENVSLDFIYGVHGQTVEQVEADALRAVSLEPDHLSAYALTLDRESLAEEVPLAKQLAKGEVSLPPDEVVVEMGTRVRHIYGRAGLFRYEISNYARPGRHSRHNALYWTGGEYLALGVGATGTIRSPAGTIRYSNQRSAERYLADTEAGRLPDATREVLERRELFAERLAMGLRLTTGIDVVETCNQFGEPVSPRLAVGERLVRGGLARWEDGRLVLTDRGADVHSAISAQLI